MFFLMNYVTDTMLQELHGWNNNIAKGVLFLQREHTQFQEQLELRDLQVRILEDQLRKINQLYFGRSSERYDERGQVCLAELFADDEELPLQHAVHLDDVLKANSADKLAALMKARTDANEETDHAIGDENGGAGESADPDSITGNDGEQQTISDCMAGSALALAQEEKRNQNKRGGGRLVLPGTLERIEKEITLPDEATRDAQGNSLTIVGYKYSESLGFRPQSYFVEVEKRAIYGKPFDDETPRMVAPSRRLYAKSQIANSMAAHCIAAKFQYHIPMYRLEQQLVHHGLGQIDRQRLSRTLIHIALLPAVQAVYAAIKDEVLMSPVVGLDDTTLPMLEPGNGKCKLTRMWALVSGKNAWYHHALTRSGKECMAILKDYQGIIQCDDYGGHNILFKHDKSDGDGERAESENPERERMGCLAHLRRYFHDALPNKHGHLVVRLIKKMYALHDLINDQFPDPPASATDQEINAMERAIVTQRQQYSRPLFDALFVHLESLLESGRYPPKTTLGKAIRYALKQQDALTLYFEHAYLDPDNNLCERAMRRIAMGRKNYLFAGCAAGGQAIAMWCTFVETCSRHGVDAERYLNWLFDQISADRFDAQHATRLTPSQYAAVMEVAANPLSSNTAMAAVA